MVNRKMTPGPWVWTKEPLTGHYELIGSDGTTVCDDGSAGMEYNPTTDVHSLDAVAISLVPEMVEFIKLVAQGDHIASCLPGDAEALLKKLKLKRKGK